MLLWFSAAVFALLAFRDLIQGARSPVSRLLRRDPEIRALQALFEGTERLRVQLECGSLPGESDWQEPFRGLSPWQEILPELLARMRASGMPVLPTLRRLSTLIRDQLEGRRKARLKTAQAKFQSLFCLALLPLLGILLPQLLAGPAENSRLWWGAVAIATTLGLFAALWIEALATAAARYGLPEPEHGLPARAALGLEHFLALLRGGTPPDLAWKRMLESLGEAGSRLRALWGPLSRPGSQAQPIPEILSRTSLAVHEAIRASLFEGRPCGERIEILADEMRKEIEAQRERELELLASRSLQPLFLCLAPAILGLLGLGLALEAGLAFSELGPGG